jgi:hypothetical protein
MASKIYLRVRSGDFVPLVAFPFCASDDSFIGIDGEDVGSVAEEKGEY